MGNLEVEIYMSNFKSFFDKNPDQLIKLIGNVDSELFYEKVKNIVEKNLNSEIKELQPTRKQLIDIILDLNGLPSNVDKVLPFITHHMGLICLN